METNKVSKVSAEEGLSTNQTIFAVVLGLFVGVLISVIPYAMYGATLSLMISLMSPLLPEGIRMNGWQATALVVIVKFLLRENKGNKAQMAERKRGGWIDGLHGTFNICFYAIVFAIGVRILANILGYA